MTNHPNRTRAHIMRICPRGFVNETTYVSVSDAEYAEADAYLDTLVDDVNDTSQWLEAGVKPVRGVDYIWPRYKAEVMEG